MFRVGPISANTGSTEAAEVAKTGITHVASGTVLRGTTNTFVMRFQSLKREDDDNDITMTDSATLGTYATIPSDGWYEAQACAYCGGVGTIGIKKGTSINNSFEVTDTDFLNGNITVPGNGYGISHSARFYAEEGELLWAMFAGPIFNAPAVTEFTVAHA